MSLFKRKQKIEVVDDRTDIEKSFEDSGQKFGRKTGELVQKGVNKIEGVKQKLESDGTLDKIRNASAKVDKKLDDAINSVSNKTKQVVEKVKKNNKDKEDNFYV